MSLHFRQELDEGVERREQLARRIGWVVIVAIVVAAVVGLFGNGLFSRTTTTVATADASISLSYSRWDRTSRPLTANLEVDAPARDEEMLQVILSPGLTDKIEVTSVLPEPDSTALSPDGAVYQWAVQDWGGPLTVNIEYRGRQWRTVSGRVEVFAGEQLLATLKLSQFLFP